LSPAHIVNVAARALVPVIGVIAFDWPAANLAIVYFADTIASIYAVSIAACGRLFWFDGQDGDSWWQRAMYGLQVGLAGLTLVAVLAIPLGVSLGLILVQLQFDWDVARHDRTLWLGVAAQFSGALALLIDDFRRLQADPHVDVLIKRRFGLVFLRWIVVMIVGYSGLGVLSPRLFGVVIVATYAGATIVMELAPGRMLRVFGAADLDPANAPTVSPTRARRRRR
jgi:hypothetical protein